MANRHDISAGKKYTGLINGSSRGVEAIAKRRRQRQAGKIIERRKREENLIKENFAMKGRY